MTESNSAPKDIWLLKQEYGYKVTLTDNFGNMVPKSRKGIQLGQKYEQVELTSRDLRQYFSKDRPNRLSAHSNGSMTTQSAQR